MVENDPLEDLGTLRNVKTVIARGRIYDNPQVKRSQIIDEQLNKYLDVTE